MCPRRSVVHSCFPCSNPWSAWASKRQCPREALLLVVKVVRVVFCVSTSNHSIFEKNLLFSYYILCSPITSSSLLFIYNIGGKQRWPMTPWERYGQCFCQTIGQAQKRALKERENTTLPKPASYRYKPTEGRYSLRSVASRSKARSSLASMISRSPGPLSLMPQRWRMPWMITRWSSSS